MVFCFQCCELLFSLWYFVDLDIWPIISRTIWYSLNSDEIGLVVSYVPNFNPFRRHMMKSFFLDRVFYFAIRHSSKWNSHE